jgi:AcrR family transcriptional regulator
MNATKSNKKQEIELREQKLLQKAGEILLTEGFAALSMERLADELKTAKGTVYNHYPNREELLLSLAVQALDKRQEMFDVASTSRGRSKERMLAIGVACEIYVSSYPQYFLVENIVRHAAIWERCSDAKRDLMRKQEHRCMALVSGVVRSAIADGDLELPNGMRPEEMTLSLWGLTYGSYLLNATSPSLQELGVDSIHRSVRFGAKCTIDGFGWQPIWTVEEHADHIERICQTVFPNEHALPPLPC